jgi:tryptophanyl-tRNA synthetase
MAQAQDINPWSVTGGQAEDGTALAIDYLALSQYVLTFMLSLAVQVQLWTCKFK